MTHWAAKYIGMAWSEDRNCWWLVREVFRERWGIDMPVIGVGDLQAADKVAVIKDAATKSGWRPVDDADPQDGDILLCRDVTGKRHVGVMVENDRGRLMLLHNEGYMSGRGAVGSVVAQPLRDALAQGLSEIELWRRA